jgi:hypothetical protein
MLYAEPWDDGYRYYYYEPGAAYPYFVRDDDYGYAYGSTGVLIAVFDARGRYLPSDVVYRVSPTAGRYYARGRDLRNAAAQARRIRVSQQDWSVRAPRITRSADPWLRAAREEPRWREWRERNPDREMRRFAEETKQRGVPARRGRERTDGGEVAVAQAETARLPRDADRRPAKLEPVRADGELRDAAAEGRRVQHAQRREMQQPDRAKTEQRSAQAERRELAEAQRRQKADAQQAQKQQRRQVQARQDVREPGGRKDKPVQHVQARAAEQHGKPAAAHERGKGHGKKD